MLQPQGGIGLLTVKLDDPTGYGRITRENGKVTGIVEHKDATDEQRQIQEIKHRHSDCQRRRYETLAGEADQQ